MKMFTRYNTAEVALNQAAAALSRDRSVTVAVVPLAKGGYLLALGYRDISDLAEPALTVETDPAYAPTSVPPGSAGG